MAHQVEPQRLLLVAEQHTLRPFGEVDNSFGRLRVRLRAGWFDSEHVILTSRCRPCLLVRAGQRLRHLVHQTAARLAESIHRTRLDHGFECSPIEFVVVYATTEFGEASVFAVQTAFGDYRLDSAAANAFDRAEAV